MPFHCLEKLFLKIQNFAINNLECVDNNLEEKASKKVGRPHAKPRDQHLTTLLTKKVDRVQPKRDIKNISLYI